MFDESWISIKTKKPKERYICKVMCTDDRITEAYISINTKNPDDYRWMDPIGHTPLDIKVTHWKY